MKKKGKKLYIVCLSVKARKVEIKAKSCILFVYPAGPGSLEEVKNGNWLFIRQGQEV